MPIVTYRDTVERRVETAREGLSLLDVSLGAGLPHFHQCNRMARCTTCRVQVLQGSENLSPRQGAEAQIALERGWPADTRLACQARALGDVTIARVVREHQTALTIFPENPETPAAEERALAVMFCDLRNFTRFAMDHLPHDVVYVLNRFFSDVCEPVLDNDGYIDKYLGDGFLAVFGLNKQDPSAICEDAARAALRIPSRMRSLNLWLQETFNTTFDFGVGLHFGPAVVGHTGHPLKMQLTVLGDTVNVASRVEGLTKRAGVRILATSDFAAQAPRFVEGGQTFRMITRANHWDTLHQVSAESAFDDALTVQLSYDAVTPNAMIFAHAFYERLFTLAPHLKPLFQNTNMATQYRMLMEMIGRTVQRLHRIHEISPALRELGQRHAGYGVSLDHYGVVGQALIETLEHHLQADFTPATREAWIVIYDRLTAFMTEGLQDGPPLKTSA